MAKRPTEILEEEHHVIQQMIGVMAQLIEELARGQKLDSAMLTDLVEFMKGFADRCHHGKEETHLFPLLEAKGVPVNGCPLGILIHEHTSGRKLVGELADSAAAYARKDPGAGESLAAAMQGLVNLYPGHIWKEDYLLFPMTDKILTPEEQNILAEKFAAVEESIGANQHQRFVQMVEKLTAITSA